MITETKTSTTDFSKNIMNFASANTTNVSNKSTSELYKTINNTSKTSKTDTKKDDFKDVLNSKSNKIDNSLKNDISKKINESKNVDELKEKIEELDEDIKKLSKDDIADILSNILNLLNKFSENQDLTNLGNKENLNSDVLKTLLDGIQNKTASSNDLDTLMKQLLEALQNDSVKDSLESDSLTLVQKLLNQLSSNIKADDSEASKGLKNGIKDLMSEISNVLENKQSKGEKVLSLEDFLKKNLTKQDSETASNNSNTSTADLKENKELAKEDKFLNSLLDDNKDDSSLSKMNLLASRTQNAPVQATGVNQNLVVNKATFTDDLIKDVKFMTTNSIKELTVKVNPGNLGEITIKLIQEDGVMKANLKANSKETTNLLSQNLVDIKKQLGEQNIKIADVNIELYQDDTTFFKGDSFEGQFSREQEKNGSTNSKVSGIASVSEDELNDEIDAEDNRNLDFLA